MSKFSEKFRAELKTKIEEFEKTTSVELVPVFVKSSSTYASLRVAWFLVIALVLFECLYLWIDIWNPVQKIITSLMLSVVVGLLAVLTPLFRYLIPRSTKRTEVEEQAIKSFALEEVFATEHRTGILILISEFEHEVFILADRGVTSVVPVEEFKQLGGKLAQDLNAKSPGDSFFKAVAEISVRVAPHFPDKNFKNELKDDLR